MASRTNPGRASQEPPPPPLLPPPPHQPAHQPAPPTSERCRLLLRQWRRELRLNGREQSLLGGALAVLDRQLERLERRHLRVAVFGRVGVGKSSLLNALLGAPVFATDVAHGCTRRQQAASWGVAVAGLELVELVDTPGIDEIAAPGRARLAARVARGVDLVLMVLDGDLTGIDQQAIVTLLLSGQPMLLVLNRSDCWSGEECRALEASIQGRLRAVLPAAAGALPLLAVAAAPRRARLRPDGKVRSDPEPPQVEPLRRQLMALLEEQGELLLALNSLGAAESLQRQLHQGRLGRGRQAAQGLIGRYAALKATGLAANPLLLLDLAGGLACDAALVAQLCQLYGLPMDGKAARELLSQLSRQNALIGGAQIGIQLVLGALRQLLLLAAPLTGGLSLAPAAPVALAQAALAVHTTRRTGRLAARELLRRGERGGQPGALRRRLMASDPLVRQWLAGRAAGDGNGRTQAPLQALLP
jgi:small GTP-binding protein